LHGQFFHNFRLAPTHGSNGLRSKPASATSVLTRSATLIALGWIRSVLLSVCNRNSRWMRSSPCLGNLCYSPRHGVSDGSQMRLSSSVRSRHMSVVLLLPHRFTIPAQTERC
jgi:hypothetical protein